MRAELDSYECRHGLGYTRIRSSQERPGRGAAVLRAPGGERRGAPGQPGEPRPPAARVQPVFTWWSSACGTPRRTQPISSATSAPAKWRWRARSSTTRPSTASAGTTSPSTRPARPSEAPLAGFDTDREAFLGLYNGFEAPRAVARRPQRRLAGAWAGPRSPPTTCRSAWPRASGGPWCSCWATRRTRPDDKWEAPGRIRKDPAREMIRRFAEPGAVDRAFAELGAHWRELALPLPPGMRRRAPGAYGQHLEPVPVPGHLQPGPQRLAVRVGHRARPGFPGHQPGPAGLRAPGARARPPADPGGGLHPEGGRQRLPPVPAADPARQRQHRRGLQRRPPVADPLGERLPEGERGLGHSGGAGSLRPRPGARRKPVRAPAPVLPARGGQPGAARPASDRHGRTGTTA